MSGAPAAGSRAFDRGRAAFRAARRFGQRAADAWFAPKRFESKALYERLGVLLVKRYAPTGGDYFIRRYGVRVVDIQGNLDSLENFERLTRRWEAIHEIAFLGFLVWSVWRAATHRTSKLNLGFAAAVYVVLILSPAMLQRYNRLRVLAVLRRHFSPSAIQFVSFGSVTPE